MSTESPLALLGYPPLAARALRDLGLIAISLPTEPLNEVLAACEVLGFLGALIHPGVQEMAAPFLYLEPGARRAGRADAVAFSGGPRGNYVAPEALLDALQRYGPAARGKSAMIIGRGPDLRVSLGLARLGLRAVTVVASHRPQAEQLLREFPAGVGAYALSRDDSAVQSLAERCEYIVLTGGQMPGGVLQPFHTVIDLTGYAAGAVQAAGATLLSLPDLPARVLARQLKYVTGQLPPPPLLQRLTEVLAAPHHLYT